MAWIEELKSRCEKLEAEIAVIEHEISALPSGELRCNRNCGYSKWFQIIEVGGKKERLYINKKDQNLAIALAHKGECLQKISDIRIEQQCIEGFLKKYSKLKLPHGSSYRCKSKEVERLLNLYDNALHCDPVISEFLSRQYVGGPYPENCTLKCLSGDFVRTKAENSIDDMLFMRGLPFLYEYPLEVFWNGKTITIHPDFIIMHPITHELYIWEHMGMMDSPNYYSRQDERIAQLCSLGFYPDDHLILTFEGGSHRLSTAEIEAKINQFFSSC